MIDGIVKADGTSRLMRATLPATYEEFKAQAAAGTLPLDVLFNADGWSQIPTFLNKLNLLADETAGLFKLGAYNTPNDVFSWIGQYNTHWWQRRTNDSYYASDLYDLVENANVWRSNNKGENSIQYSEELDINNETGWFDLLNPKTVAVGYNSGTNANVLKGKYFKPMDYGTAQSIRFAPKDAADAYAQLENNKYVVKITSYAVRTVYVDGAGEWELVHSSDENTYPLPNDVFEYQYLGIPFQNAVTAPKIATGNYTGTGTYGASNPNSIAFDFEPKLVFMVAETSGLNYSELSPTAIGIRGMVIPFYLMGTSYANSWGFTSNTSYSSYGKRDGNTMYWYNDKSASYQLNGSGQTFYWLAIG